MKEKIKKAISIISLIILFVMSGKALASEAYVGGGYWNYGVWYNVWSTYDHSSAIHSSSVVNGENTWDFSGCRSAGETAYASINASWSPWSGINKSYWKNWCD